MAVNNEEGHILGQINSLASKLQEQRMHPLKDGESQRKAVMKIQQELSSCWIKLREERAGPRFELQGKYGPPNR